MLTSNSSRKTGKLLSKLCIAVCAVTLFILTGCPEKKKDAVDLTGTWVSYDTYTFEGKTLTYFDGGWGFDYSADIQEIVYNPDENFGYVYIKYTSVGTLLSPEMIGQYTAVFFTDYTPSASMKMANPYKATDPSPYAATLSSAKSTYTVENGYYASTGSYTYKK